MEAGIRAQIAQYCNLLHEWNASYEEYAKSAGLSYTSLSVLSAIYSNPGRTQKELAEDCFLPKQTVNAVITSFLKNDWVRLEEMPEDRRNKTVNFTEIGMENAAKIIDKVRECEDKAMSGLTGEQRDALLDLTRMYIRSCSSAMKNE
ncbi:MarR family transcriptional regulator [Kineothrix sp. MSJ-39]|uniref:MarR family winged helix-turn-helix transcriptional regulator n=1 Tax=Kineothrix sp. MSJ-39 TaxID=2841533 RepID=UPI001C109658|nr:MarR family transcriptional regulator [Kineothrix sp. MSJ-39]MBU5428754.1 MarR family transcriptional regulator [Kineothrix sp. MSJ-39]